MGYPMSGHNTILCRYLSTDSRPSVGRPLAHSNPCRTSDSCSIWSLRPVVSELHLRDILRGHAATGRKRRENKKRGSPTGLIAASLQVISLLASLAACSHALENQASVVWCVINEFKRCLTRKDTDAKAIDFFANQLGITVSSDHTSRSHGTGKRGRTPRPIIVRLVFYNMTVQLLRKRRELKARETNFVGRT